MTSLKHFIIFLKPLGFPLTVFAFAFYSHAFDRVLSGNGNSFTEVRSSPLIQVIASAALYFSLVGHLLLKVPRKLDPLVLSTIALIALCVISTSWSSNPDLSLKRSISVAGVVITMSFLLRAIGREQMWQALVLFSAILVIVQFLLMLIAPGYAFHSASDIGVAEHAGRFRGVFFHKNEAARFGLVALIIILVTKKRFSKITWIVLLCCAASTLGATQSSKAIVALVASVSALWYMKLRIAPATKFIIALTCLVGAILIYSFIGFEDIIVGVAETLGRDATLSGRDVVWQLAFDQIKEKPLLGGGFHAGWPQSATDYLVKLKGPTGGLSHAHNGYLQLLLDIGVIGLLLTMLPSLFLIGSLFSVHPDDSDEIANFSVLFVGVYFTLNLAGSYLLSGNDIFHWLILFSVICLRNVPKLKK